MAATIRRLVEVGIPVMGHVGLMPQLIHAMGGYRVQGRESPQDSGVASAESVLADAEAVQDAGAFSIVLEGIPAELAAQITEGLSITTIRIGAGPSCDGQVLVMHDMLGLTIGRWPTFVKEYASLGETIASAVGCYIHEVKAGILPADANSFHDNKKPTPKPKAA